MDQSIGETWCFTMHVGPAEQVYLAIDGPITPSRWTQMQPMPNQPGAWSVITTLMPGRNRLRTFTIDSGTTLNCGSVGLTGERLSPPNPQVHIEDFGSVAVPA